MNDLTEHLAREADAFERRGGTALHLDQVLDRAGEIRRGRRLRATLVMAAVVVAIAVPAGLVALDRDGSREPSPAPSPTRVDTAPLTIRGLSRGAQPSIYLGDGVLVNGGRTSPLPPGRPTAFASSRGGVVLATQTAGGTSAQVLGVEAVTSWPVEGDFAVSADGTIVASVRPDGTPVVLESDDQGQNITRHELPKVPRGSGFDTVAVTGTTCRSPAASVCAVWVTTNGRRPASWVSTPEGVTRVEPAQGGPGAAARMWRLSDVRDDGMQAGMIDVSDSGSCSRVQSGAGTALWTTCKHQLGSFSPDGKHLTGLPAYSDGAGSSELAVLDASTGKVVLDLRTAQDAFVGQVVWEDADHVLATVAEDGRWAVVRIGLDGSREYAVAPVTGKDPYVSPFMLLSR